MDSLTGAVAASADDDDKVRVLPNRPSVGASLSTLASLSPSSSLWVLG